MTEDRLFPSFEDVIYAIHLEIMPKEQWPHFENHLMNLYEHILEFLRDPACKLFGREDSQNMSLADVTEIVQEVMK